MDAGDFDFGYEFAIAAHEHFTMLLRALLFSHAEDDEIPLGIGDENFSNEAGGQFDGMIGIFIDVQLVLNACELALKDFFLVFNDINPLRERLHVFGDTQRLLRGWECLTIQIQLDIRIGKVFVGLGQIFLERRDLFFQRVGVGNRGIALFLGGIEVFLGLVERGGGLLQIRGGLCQTSLRGISTSGLLVEMGTEIGDGAFDLREIQRADSQSCKYGDDKTDSNQHGLGSKVLL